MGLSAKQLSMAVEEFSPDLVHGVIRKVDQPNPKTILFEIEQGRRRHHLLFSAHPRFSRCHLIQGKYGVKPKTPPNFCQLLRAHLRHKRIASILQLDGDRIIQLTAAWPKDHQMRLTFVAELTGPSSNLFLLNEKEAILGCLNTPNPGRRLLQGVAYTPPPLIQKSDFKETPISCVYVGQYPFNCAVEKYYAESEKTEHAERIKKETLARFEESIRSFKKRLQSLKASRAAAEKSAQYQRYGEFLKCRLHEVKAGATFFLYFETPSNPTNMEMEGEERTVALDPALSPAENMARFFKRYKKGITALATLNPLIEEAGGKLAQLEAGRKAVLEDEPIDLSDFPLKLPRPQLARQTKKKGPPVYLSSDKLRIFAGRNDRENEKITFGLARGNDLWLHARGTSGGHVLIQMAGRKEVPHSTLLEAATLAIHLSRYKKEGRGEVMYTFKKYLQRPKKGRPGSVLCAQEKTIYLEIVPERLSRILQNRLEESQTLV